jgi:hypothetical protein
VLTSRNLRYTAAGELFGLEPHVFLNGRAALHPEACDRGVCSAAGAVAQQDGLLSKHMMVGSSIQPAVATAAALVKLAAAAAACRCSHLQVARSLPPWLLLNRAVP